MDMIVVAADTQQKLIMDLLLDTYALTGTI